MSKSGIENAKNMLAVRQRDYLMTFNGEQAKRVLDDLAEFCFAHKPTFHADPRAHAFSEGRREVWLRIQHHLQLSNEQIWEIYRRKDIAT